MRVVVDTNVIVAGLTSPKGANRRVLRHCIHRNIQPLMGMALFQEIEDVVWRPATQKRCPLDPEEIRILINAVYASSMWVKVHFLWRPNLMDESDNHLVELAIAGNAECIVTNNIRDLKNGQLSFPHLKIQTPQQLLESLS